MKCILVITCFLICHSAYSQNEFYFNGAADVIMRYPPRGSGGRAIVHDDGNILTLNYGGDFSGGTKMGNNFFVKNNGYVGIGTTNFGYASDGRGSLAINGNNSSLIELQAGVVSRGYLLADGSNKIELYSVGDLNFSTNSAVRAIINSAGNMGIGTSDPKGYKLAVAGPMIAESVKVKLQGSWPDFIFDPSYHLTSLSELEKYIKINKHLPEIPSAQEVKEYGLSLGEMNAKLLKKIEELTLLLIELNTKVENQQKEIIELKKDKQ